MCYQETVTAVFSESHRDVQRALIRLVVLLLLPLVSSWFIVVSDNSAVSSVAFQIHGTPHWPPFESQLLHACLSSNSGERRVAWEVLEASLKDLAASMLEDYPKLKALLERGLRQTDDHRVRVLAVGCLDFLTLWENEEETPQLNAFSDLIPCVFDVLERTLDEPDSSSDVVMILVTLRNCCAVSSVMQGHWPAYARGMIQILQRDGFEGEVYPAASKSLTSMLQLHTEELAELWPEIWAACWATLSAGTLDPAKVQHMLPVSNAVNILLLAAPNVEFVPGVFAQMKEALSHSDARVRLAAFSVIQGCEPTIGHELVLTALTPFGNDNHESLRRATIGHISIWCSQVPDLFEKLHAIILPVLIRALSDSQDDIVATVCVGGRVFP
jgi:hypothetical protein